MAVVQLDTEERQPENGFVSPETTSSSPGVLTRVDQDVLPFLGGFGKYQRQLIALTWIPALFIGFSQYSDNFLLAQPNNTCVRPLANASDWPAAPSSLLDGARNMSAPPLLPAHVHANGSHRGGHNDSSRLQCACSEWTFELHTGLVRNVVTKVSGQFVLFYFCMVFLFYLDTLHPVHHVHVMGHRLPPHPPSAVIPFGSIYVSESGAEGHL